MLLSLKPEELAGYILEYFNSNRDPNKFKHNRADFANDDAVRKYPVEKQDECQKALMEAWSCLVREGLIMPEPGNRYPIYILTRRGKKLRTRKDYDSFRKASLFPKDSIHPELVDNVYSLFLRGDYDTAIFQAFKLVEISVREASSPDYKALYGVDLMRKAFHPEHGPLTDKSEPKAERESLLALFAGSIGRFKNPSSHRHVAITSPTEAIEMVQLASHLLRLVDDRKKCE